VNVLALSLLGRFRDQGRMRNKTSLAAAMVFLFLKTPRTWHGNLEIPPQLRANSFPGPSMGAASSSFSRWQCSEQQPTDLSAPSTLPNIDPHPSRGASTSYTTIPLIGPPTPPCSELRPSYPEWVPHHQQDDKMTQLKSSSPRVHGEYEKPK
jgi:hypothetical protein